jgi:hypothetical protein
VAVKLHRCKSLRVKFAGHPCWKVQKALDDMNIEYEVAPGANPWQRGQRNELMEKTGQNLYPVIEFEDGSIYREESKEMAKTIRAGKLFERAGTPS